MFPSHLEINFDTTPVEREINPSHERIKRVQFKREIENSIQQVAEIYAVGTPDSTGFIAVVAADTANGAETSSNVQATTYGQLEAFIKAAVEADTSATVVELTFDGVSIS